MSEWSSIFYIDQDKHLFDVARSGTRPDKIRLSVDDAEMVVDISDIYDLRNELTAYIRNWLRDEIHPVFGRRP